MRSVLLLFLLTLPALSSQQSDSRPVILALGDSMTAGFGVPAESSYPAQLQKLLDIRGYRYRVINMGVSGDTSAGGRTRLSRALTTNPIIVILELGANDRSNGLSPKQTSENLEQIITTFQKTHIAVVLAGRTQTGVDNIYTELAGKYHLALIPSFLEGVSGHPDLTISDMTHPNADGYAIVVNTVMKILEPLLKKPAAKTEP
jgi:acyl-CoA thioesterase-1